MPRVLVMKAPLIGDMQGQSAHAAGVGVKHAQSCRALAVIRITTFSECEFLPTED